MVEFARGNRQVTIVTISITRHTPEIQRFWKLNHSWISFYYDYKTNETSRLKEHILIKYIDSFDYTWSPVAVNTNIFKMLTQ